MRKWQENKVEDYEIEQSYSDLLDDIYPSYVINGMEYMPSDILKNCDPIAYRVGLSDYESELEEEE
jgi:hypothetical protein